MSNASDKDVTASVVEARDDDAIIEAADQKTRASVAKGLKGPPPFTWSSLWQTPPVNPVNLKSYTIPMLNLKSVYARNFHLSWLGFFVAFFSWFAFPPLIPEAIRADLGLTAAQVSNSNIVALCATLVMRVVLGPLVDRFGPRKCMAAILVLGAIPSGLAGTAFNANALYVIRFFIGILGGTFVMCQAWTTSWFDKSVVGTANALVGGWGNAGGGVVFVVQTALFTRLVDGNGVSPHNAWRACFAIIPVPLLLLTAAATMIFGTDHPAGRWSARHTTPATAIAMTKGGDVHLDRDERKVIENKSQDKEAAKVSVVVAEDDKELDAMVTSGVDTAVNEVLTVKKALKIMSSPYTLLPALMYFTTFGWELFFDSSFANTLFAIYATRGRDSSFTQLKAGYITAILGLLNFFTRPFGGYVADKLYAAGYGVRSKKFLTIALGFLMGCMSLAMGLIIDRGTNNGAPGTSTPALASLIVLEVLAAIFCEMANGTNFSMVPHCNVNSNGVMTGLVGAAGNLGGIFFALVIRLQPAPLGRAYWITGAVSMIINAICIFIPCPAT